MAGDDGTRAVPVSETGPTAVEGTRAVLVTGTGATKVEGTRPRLRSGRRRIGDGLVEVPVREDIEPTSAILTNPVVAESKRYCVRASNRSGAASRSTGTAKAYVELRRDILVLDTAGSGELVAGQYDVQGCIAHGGVGWIYLAIDRNVSDRWVVLKGLLQPGGQQAQAIAVAERQFLAMVNHPGIVKIYNFVEHPGFDGRPIGYIGWSTSAAPRCRRSWPSSERKRQKANPSR
jgi:serine/threonine-protein kinase PknG